MLILTIIGLTILGLFWCSWWGRETFIEWFPIVGHFDVFLDNINKKWGDSDFWGGLIWLLSYIAVIIIPVVLILIGFAFVTDGANKMLPFIFEVAGWILAVVGYNLNGVLEIVLFIFAVITVLIGFITSIKNGFFYGLFGTLLLLGGLFLLPAALANFGLLLIIAIGIAVIVALVYSFFYTISMFFQ